MAGIGLHCVVALDTGRVAFERFYSQPLRYLRGFRMAMQGHESCVVRSLLPNGNFGGMAFLATFVSQDLKWIQVYFQVDIAGIG